MRSMLTFLAISFISLCCQAQGNEVLKPEDHGTIYFLRSTGMMQSGNAFSIFIDDTLACRLNNKKFSVHSLSPGVHQVSAQFIGFKPKEKDAKTAVIIEPGKTYYLQVILHTAAFNAVIYCQEVDADPAKKLLVQLKEDTHCFK